LFHTVTTPRGESNQRRSDQNSASATRTLQGPAEIGYTPSISGRFPSATKGHEPCDPTEFSVASRLLKHQTLEPADRGRSSYLKRRPQHFGQRHNRQPQTLCCVVLATQALDEILIADRRGPHNLQRHRLQCHKMPTLFEMPKISRFCDGICESANFAFSLVPRCHRRQPPTVLFAAVATNPLGIGRRTKPCNGAAIRFFRHG